jgi:hypothetical protein
VQLLLKDSKKENSEFSEILQHFTLESIIQKSKNKKYMKEKYRCKFCAFYHQIDLPDKQLEELIYKQLIKKLYKLTNIDFSGYKIEDLDYFNEYKKISEEKDSLIKSILFLTICKNSNNSYHLYASIRMKLTQNHAFIMNLKYWM